MKLLMMINGGIRLANVTRQLLPIEVSDVTGCAILILFDYDVYYLVRKSCVDMLASIPQGTKSVEYPLDFKSLISRKLLFKVANTTISSPDHSGIYRVRGVCDDPSIIVGSITPANLSNIGSGNISGCPSQIVGYAEKVAMTAVSLGDDSTVYGDCTPNVKRPLGDILGETSTCKAVPNQRSAKNLKK
ncbi:hypothetical protein RIF29_28397 [Crotalaria pallida]|uniref:Uncharacterized protein n=1 Tax=Crotalaria pallida TaxID=3830 RepID=A0AAN9ED11_CROPI